MKIKRFTSLLLLLSMTSMLVQPVNAEEYMVLPPIVDQQAQSTGIALPGLNSMPVLLQGNISTVPVGTSFQVITNAEITSKNSKVGEIFTATLNQPIYANGNVAIPAGSEVFGQITYIEDAGRVGRHALMEIKFTSIKPPYADKIPMIGKILTTNDTGVLKGGSIKRQLSKTVSTGTLATASGAVAGIGIGSLFSGATVGAAVGAIAGGVVGLGYIVARKGKSVKLPVGTKMTVVLEQPLALGK